MIVEWDRLDAALARVAEEGRRTQVWLRDDDAVVATPQLDRLADLAERFRIPVLLAVIPNGTDQTLRRRLDTLPLFTAAQHGYAHVNHATPEERARELGGRSPSIILGELAAGREKLQTLFGERLSDILVPPWNRIDAAVVPHLASLGYSALSTFGPPVLERPDLPALNATIDPVDWRNGRGLRSPAKLVGHIAELVDSGEPIGVLTHHLAHDEATWEFVEACLARLAASTSVVFVSAEELRRRRVSHSGAP